ncbi:MAG: response regulator [Geminocystis sp.]|nr:response regulator [Geminocystis sp.]
MVVGFLSQWQEKIENIYREKASGKLLLQEENGDTKTVFFHRGVLQYTVCKFTRRRRWQRAVATKYPQYATGYFEGQLWEYELLRRGVVKKEITLLQAKSVISQVTEECLLELCLSGGVTWEWQGREKTDSSSFAYFLSLPPSEILEINNRVTRLSQQWLREGWQKPNLAPLLSEEGKTVFKDAPQRGYLNGNYTMWDIAASLKQPIEVVAKSLKDWGNRGLITFVTPPPEEGEKTTADAVKKAQRGQEGEKNRDNYLIACIDDSPVILQTLKKILQEAGFATLLISEPMAGLGKILEHKPDLIILDLNLPNASGHSVCRFLRESPVFQNTPIIILSAKDGTLDKTKAKLAGATDFLPKPPVADKLIATVNLYLSSIPMAKQSGVH